VGLIRLGDDEETRDVTVEAVDDPRSPLATSGREP
jgi:hypothetical protein